MNTSPPPKPPDILSVLTALSQSGQLERGIRKTDHFTEADEESNTRRSRSNFGKTINQIKTCSMWVLFCFGAVLAGLLAWILIKEVDDLVSNAQARETSLSWIWNTVLTVLATLFFERAVERKKND